MRAHEVLGRLCETDKVTLRAKWDALRRATLALKNAAALSEAQRMELYRAYERAAREYSEAISQ